MKKTVQDELFLDLGTVVRLTSGSPKMTIIGRKKGFMLCAWVPYNSGVPQQAYYPRKALVWEDES